MENSFILDYHSYFIRVYRTQMAYNPNFLILVCRICNLLPLESRFGIAMQPKKANTDIFKEQSYIDIWSTFFECIIKISGALDSDDPKGTSEFKPIIAFASKQIQRRHKVEREKHSISQENCSVLGQFANITPVSLLLQIKTECDYTAVLSKYPLPCYRLELPSFLYLQDIHSQTFSKANIRTDSTKNAFMIPASIHNFTQSLQIKAPELIITAVHKNLKRFTLLFIEGP